LKVRAATECFSFDQIKDSSKNCVIITAETTVCRLVAVPLHLLTLTDWENQGYEISPVTYNIKAAAIFHAFSSFTYTDRPMVNGSVITKQFAFRWG
jgi:hypothetical protein